MKNQDPLAPSNTDRKLSSIAPSIAEYFGYESFQNLSIGDGLFLSVEHDANSRPDNGAMINRLTIGSTKDGQSSVMEITSHGVSVDGAKQSDETADSVLAALPERFGRNRAAKVESMTHELGIGFRTLLVDQGEDATEPQAESTESIEQQLHALGPVLVEAFGGYNSVSRKDVGDGLLVSVNHDANSRENNSAIINSVTLHSTNESGTEWALDIHSNGFVRLSPDNDEPQNSKELQILGQKALEKLKQRLADNKGASDAEIGNRFS